MNLSTHLLGHIHNHNGMNKRLALLNQRTFNIKKNQVLQKKETPQPIGSTHEVFRNCSFPQLLLLQNADLNNRLLRSIMIDQPNTILVSVDKSYLVLQALAFYFFCSVLQALAFLFFFI